mmetsp:Transcript_48919/g.77975  ORF Transcript_48919/g.77975 Transcript_48919/m.77975 type:complete len:101 (-) Transcript_48919:79-381(-)
MAATAHSVHTGVGDIPPSTCKIHQSNCCRCILYDYFRQVRNAHTTLWMAPDIKTVAFASIMDQQVVQTIHVNFHAGQPTTARNRDMAVFRLQKLAKSPRQ